MKCERYIFVSIHVSKFNCTLGTVKPAYNEQVYL